MIISALVSAAHIVGFGIGLASVVARGRALRQEPFDDAARGRALRADNAWGISFLLLVPTGLARAFAGLEKGAAFYTSSPMFWVKMALLVVIVALEAWPMVTLIRWRVRQARGQPVHRERERTWPRRFSTISMIEAALLCAMVACAALMARGFLLMPSP